MTSAGDSKFLRDQLASDFIGARIIGVSQPDDDGFFDITIEIRNDKFTMTLSADPEGNGPGFLFIDEVQDGQASSG